MIKSSEQKTCNYFVRVVEARAFDTSALDVQYKEGVKWLAGGIEDDIFRSYMCP